MITKVLETEDIHQNDKKKEFLNLLKIFMTQLLIKNSVHQNSQNAIKYFNVSVITDPFYGLPLS